MSECLICRGSRNVNISNKILIYEPGNFLKDIAFKLWGDCDVWTIKINGKDIDYYLTDAQYEMNKGIGFEKTELYNILNELVDSGIKLAMWYDTYYEDLPLCTTKEEVLSICRDGIMDVSGMCEVYFIMN